VVTPHSVTSLTYSMPCLSLGGQRPLAYLISITQRLDTDTQLLFVHSIIFSNYIHVPVPNCKRGWLLIILIPAEIP